MFDDSYDDICTWHHCTIFMVLGIKFELFKCIEPPFNIVWFQRYFKIMIFMVKWKTLEGTTMIFLNFIFLAHPTAHDCRHTPHRSGCLYCDQDRRNWGKHQSQHLRTLQSKILGEIQYDIGIGMLRRSLDMCAWGENTPKGQVEAYRGVNATQKYGNNRPIMPPIKSKLERHGWNMQANNVIKTQSKWRYFLKYSTIYVLGV